MLRYLQSFILVFTLSASLHASVAKITSLSGTATIERGAKSLSAALGSDLESKDTIATTAASKAQLTFKDNTIITVGKQSRFSIEEYLFDASGSSNAKFNVISGTVRAMSGKIGKIAPDKFMVKTKTATIGIRGTDFVVHVADDGSISIFCLQGSIIVRDQNGNEVIVDAGSYVTLTPSGAIDGPHEFTSSELNKLLENGFFIPYTLKTPEKVDFDTLSEPILAAEGTNEILHPDESLERGNIITNDDILTTTYWGETSSNILNDFRNNAITMSYQGDLTGTVDTTMSGVTTSAIMENGHINIDVNFGADTFSSLSTFTAGTTPYSLSFDSGTVSTSQLTQNTLTSFKNMTTNPETPLENPAGSFNATIINSDGKTMIGNVNATGVPYAAMYSKVSVQGAFQATAP